MIMYPSSSACSRCSLTPPSASKFTSHFRNLSNSCKEILSKIDQIILDLISKLNNQNGEDPCIHIQHRSNNSSFTADYHNDTTTTTATTTKSMSNLSTCRSYTSIILILSYIQQLVIHQKSTTIREIYYHYVTHFRNQRECENVINEICMLLQVENRSQLGLFASPKGWFCGSVMIHEWNDDDDNDNNNSNRRREYNVVNGMAMSSNQGIPITREWIIRASQQKQQQYKPHQYQQQPQQHNHNVTNNTRNNFKIHSNAKCILIIEKEGIFLRLTEDRFFDKYPCIIITGKGYPDIATRALVYTLHTQNPHLPVYGLCDCNPFGLSIIQTFYKGSEKRYGDGGDVYSVPIQWIGLRPSFVKELKDKKKLPSQVFQKLTDFDKKKIVKLSCETNAFVHHNNNNSNNNTTSGKNTTMRRRRFDELLLMKNLGYKVELESLNWLGIDYITNWLFDVLVVNEQYREQNIITCNTNKMTTELNEVVSVQYDHNDDHGDDDNSHNNDFLNDNSHDTFVEEEDDFDIRIAI